MTVRFHPKPTPSWPYLLDGRRVSLSEAARTLGVGLATVLRHTSNGRINTAAIKTLVPSQPLRMSSPDHPRLVPYAGKPSHHETIADRNRKIISRVVAAFHEARA